MISVTKLPALTDEAAAKLRPLVADVEWPLLCRDIATGRAELFEFPGRTFAVTRTEADTGELVVCALSGRAARDLFAAGINIARANKLRSIRFHTQRKGLARLLGEFGLVESETVYRVAL